jgi:hypothetical protein
MGEVFGRFFPSLKGDSKYTSTKLLTTNGYGIIVVEQAVDVAGAVALFKTSVEVARAKHHGLRLVSFDVEWEYDPAAIRAGTGDTSQKPTLAQYGTDGLVLLVRLCSFDEVPSLIKAFHENDDYHFLGHTVVGDLTKMVKHFGCKMPTNVIDIVPMAKARVAATNTGRWRLADITDIVLKKRLLKTPALRNSFFNQPGVPLTHDQQTYAAADVIAPYEIYHQLMLTTTLEQQLEDDIADMLGEASDEDVDVGTNGAASDGAESEFKSADLNGIPFWSAVGSGSGGVCDDVDVVDTTASDDPDVDLVIKPHPSQADVFHVEQNAAIAFTTTNSWSPIMLKMLSELLLVSDPVVTERVVEYLVIERRRKRTFMHS